MQANPRRIAARFLGKLVVVRVCRPKRTLFEFALSAESGMPKMTTPKRKGKAKVSKVMHEFKEGTLKSGSGKTVTNRKQAVAVALSEARRSGARIPKAS